MVSPIPPCSLSEGKMEEPEEEARAGAIVGSTLVCFCGTPKRGAP